MAIYTKTQLEDASTGPFKTNTTNAIGSAQWRDQCSSIMGCFGHLSLDSGTSSLSTTPTQIPFDASEAAEDIAVAAGAGADFTLTAAEQNGEYVIDFHLYGSIDSTDEVICQLYLNDSAVTGAVCGVKSAASGSEFTISLPWTLALVNADFIDVRVDVDAGTPTLTYKSTSFRCRRIG